MKSLFLIVVLHLMLLPTSAVAGSEGVKDYIRSNPELTEENIFIYQGLKSDFVVSIGTAEIKGNTPRDKLSAMRIAQLEAQGEIMKYLHGVFSNSKKTFKTILVFKESGSSTDMSEVQRFSETIIEKGHGIINNVKEIMRWKSQNSREYFIAIGLELEK